MSINYIGSQGMVEQFTPAPTTNEFGVDVLAREFRGSVTKYTAFMAALKVGDTYTFGSSVFYLQGWQEIADPVYPGVRLFYKGFTRGAPKNKSRTESVAMSGNKGATVTSGGEDFTCTKDVQYIGQQTTYDYFTTTEPTGAKYSVVDSALHVVYLNSKIAATDSAGKTTVYVGNAPSAIATALAMGETDTTTGFSFERVYGTPYFQCQDVVTRLLV